MIRSEFSFLSADGKTPIHAVEWVPDGDVQAVLQISHGIAEYVLRYEPLAQFLTGRGIAVVGHDHLGHGSSVLPGAPRLYFGPRGSWNVVVQDLFARRKLAQGRFPGKPYFLLGHSMGSFLARTYLIDYPGTVDGAILMGTGQMPLPLLAGGRIVAAVQARKVGADHPSALVEQLAFGGYNRRFAPNRTPFDWLSRNPENVERYLRDPLCGEAPTVGLFQEMLDGLLRIRSPQTLKKMKPDTPILFLSGSMDPVGDCGAGVRRASRSFLRAGVRDVTCKLYPGLRHEILQEDCWETVYNDLFRWLEVHCTEKQRSFVSI